MASVLAGLTVVVTGVVTGVFFAVAVSVLPALFAMPPEQYLTTHGLLGRGYHPIMPVVVNLGTLSALTLWITGLRGDRWAYGLIFLLLVGVQCISHLGNVPINRRIAAMRSEGLADSWADPRPRWRQLHTLRACCALTAFLVAVGAVVPLT